jgi:quinol-cytochrome oxidoreductase complex cytochrome b subunit
MKYVRFFLSRRPFWLKVMMTFVVIQTIITLLGFAPLSVLSQSSSDADIWIIKWFALIPQLAAAFLFCIWLELKSEQKIAN